MTDPPRGNSATRARWQTCLRLAREALLARPDGKDLKLEYLHTLMDTGCLGPTRHPRKKILVTGGDSTPKAKRYLYALRNLQALHGRGVEVFFTGRGAPGTWARDPYAFGEAAIHTAYQMSSFHLDVSRAEGPVHFAGEHTSLKHAWIEGALESAALAVHQAPPVTDREGPNQDASGADREKESS